MDGYYHHKITKFPSSSAPFKYGVCDGERFRTLRELVAAFHSHGFSRHGLEVDLVKNVLDYEIRPEQFWNGWDVAFLLLLPAAYANEFLLHNLWCSVLFLCGCQAPPPLGAGWDHCNVHRTDGGPKCPFCAHPGVVTTLTTEWLPCLAWAAAVLVLWRRHRCGVQSLGDGGEALVPQPAGAVRGWRQGAAAWLRALVAAEVAWMATLTVVGFAYRVHYQYPHFLFKEL